VNLKDLYVKHPTKPGLWAYNGRNDDIVVLSNGYKISPLDTEALITTHPAIDGCLMVSKKAPYRVPPTSQTKKKKKKTPKIKKKRPA